MQELRAKIAALNIQQRLNMPDDVLGGTKEWFNRAISVPTEKNQNVQVGVHFEEVGEMLDTMTSPEEAGQKMIAEARTSLTLLAKALKSGIITMQITDRKEFFDALLDQIVTATGCGHMNGMQIIEGLLRVNVSNFSKFDENGQPIFDANGKIAKSQRYAKPDLEGLY